MTHHSDPRSGESTYRLTNIVRAEPDQSLFMLPASARSAATVEVLGHEAAIWCVGNRTFVLIADEPKQEVQRLASFVQNALH